MLTKELSDRLEKQQRRALNIIYGFNYSYSELLIKADTKSMSDRREDACAAFSKSLLNSERFKTFFPEKEYPENAAVTRNRRMYQEDFARTNRLFNSPLYAMRRYLNREDF